MKAYPVKTVLICDDESRTRLALKALLFSREIVQENNRSTVIQVVGEANDGAEAVQMVEEHQPEVVIMDACTPGIGSMEATRLIKHSWPHVKVIFLTMEPDIRPAALDAGVDTFLLKGCPPEALFRAILD